MKTLNNDTTGEIKTPKRGRGLLWLALAIGAGVLIGVPLFNGSSSADPDRPAGGMGESVKIDPGKNLFAKVQRGDLTISLLVPGTIETKNSTTIVNRIEGEAKIIWVIDEGAMVKAGDKLLELEAPGLDDRIYEQRADVLRGEADFNSATQDLRMQEQENESNMLTAQNSVEVADLELKKYEEGSYQQQQMTRNSDITIASLELQRAEERLKWTEKLVEKGYVSSGEKEADELTVKKQQIQLEQAMNALSVFENYEAKAELLKLRNTVREAKAVLARTILDNQFKLRSREIAVETAKAELEHESLRLAQLEEQKAYTSLYAPQEGMVVYANDNDRFNAITIEIGSSAQNRQKLLELPDFSAWSIDTKVHESVIQQVNEGQAAYISVDAFPQSSLTGRVSKISVMPDSGNRWMSPDVKVYTVDLDIGAPNLPLKPGMTTKNEIVLAELDGVLYVPISAVSSQGRQAYAMVKGETGVRKTPIQIGKANDRFVEVREGLREGDEVMLMAQAGGVAGLIQRPSGQQREEREGGGGEGRRRGNREGRPAGAGDQAPGMTRQPDQEGGRRGEGAGRIGQAEPPVVEGEAGGEGVLQPATEADAGEGLPHG